jgi:WD40 repeat protein
MRRAPTCFSVLAVAILACDHRSTIAGDAPKEAIDRLPPEAIARLGTTRFRPCGDGAIAFTPDGESILCSGWESPSVLLSVDTGLVHLSLHQKAKNHAHAVATSPDGRLLATNDSNTIYLWDVGTGHLKHQLNGHEGFVTGLSFVPATTFLVSTSLDKTLRVWDVEKGTLVRTCSEPDGDSFDGLAITADGRWSAVIARDSVQLWDAKLWKSVWRSPSDFKPNRNVACAPKGGYFVAGDLDGVMRLWHIPSGREISQFSSRKGKIRAVDISPNGERVACYSEDGVLQVWEVATRRVAWAVDGVDATCIKFSPNDKVLAASGYSSAVRMWEVATGKESVRWPGHFHRVTSATFSPDGRLIVTGGTDAAVYTWTASEGRLGSRFLGHTDAVNDAVFLRDCRSVVTCGNDSNVVLWDSVGNQVRWSVAVRNARPLCVALTPDGKRVAVGCAEEGTVRLLDSRDGHELSARSVGQLSAVGVVFAPSPGALFVACGHEVVALSPETLERIGTVARDVRNISKLSLSPNGRVLATLDSSGQVHLHWADTGVEFHRFPTAYSEVASIAFSPDGRLIATGGWDGTIRLWESVTGREAYAFHGHERAARCVSFSPDGRLLASGSADTTALLWDVAGTHARQSINDSSVPGTIPEIWNRLASGDAVVAFRSIRELAAARKTGISFLKERFTEDADLSRARGLLEALGDNRFNVRENARKELGRMRFLAEEPLRQLLSSSNDPEIKRQIRQLLEEMRHREIPAESLRWSRALQAVEWMDAAEARRFLQELARGSQFDERTIAAVRALKRMAGITAKDG